ncbi:hypothetical protein Aau02nite_72770 [Amorphoplanes auranticolor]|uniref:Uncharacterized protein n=1 Tax=Actinoplanes auranticolor TaxID=47988 RepID=A0A919SSL0_9ACTN|nr:hypothetical protein Aau02nite_72770 [Actinoplanes auranticolor]
MRADEDRRAAEADRACPLAGGKGSGPERVLPRSGPEPASADGLEVSLARHAGGGLFGGVEGEVGYLVRPVVSAGVPPLGAAVPARAGRRSAGGLSDSDGAQQVWDADDEASW